MFQHWIVEERERVKVGKRVIEREGGRERERRRKEGRDAIQV